MKKTFTIITALLLLILAGCSIDEPGVLAGEITGRGEAPKNNAVADMGSSSRSYTYNDSAEFIGGVSNGYIDIATSATDMYLLWDAGYNIYLDKFTLTGNYTFEYKQINLDHISYVSPNWGVIGADNAGQEIKLNCMGDNPIRIPYPSDVPWISAIDAIEINEFTVEIYINIPLEPEYENNNLIKKCVYYAYPGKQPYADWYAKSDPSLPKTYKKGLMVAGDYLYTMHNYLSIGLRRKTRSNYKYANFNTVPDGYNNGYSYNGAIQGLWSHKFDHTVLDGDDYFYFLQKTDDETHVVRLLLPNL